MSTLDQVLEAAKIVVELWLHGDKIKRQDICRLSGAIKAYESQQETVKLSKPITPNPNEIF